MVIERGSVGEGGSAWSGGMGAVVAMMGIDGEQQIIVRFAKRGASKVREGASILKEFSIII